MKNTFQTVMTELSNAFERATRTDGTTFYRLKEDSDTWVNAPWLNSALMHTLHEAVDDRMPDDWIYESIAGIASAFATDYESTDPDDAQEDSCEIADSQTDTYNSDLAKWLASHNANASLCDEARSEGLVAEDADLADRIRMGQYVALQRLAGAIIHAVQERSEYLDEQDSEMAEVAQ